MRLYFRGIATALTAALRLRNKQGSPHQFSSLSAIRFGEEASAYIKRLTSQGEAGELDVFAKKIFTVGASSLISCIPCALGEKVNPISVGRYIRSIGMADGHTIIFVNTYCAKSTEATLINYCRGLTELLKVYCSPGDFTIISHRFDVRQSIGKIRSLLVNAIVVHMHKCQLVDPIVISSDIDITATPENYGAIVRRHFMNDALDVLSGPVHYGYSPDGTSYLDSNIPLPELLLGNRVFHARRMLLLDYALAGGRFFTTEGPHTAYRLSAYCAAGGYDPRAEAGEDLQLGIGIFSLRGPSPNAFAQSTNTQYDLSFWLASDPRRQLRAIVSQRTMRDTWLHSPFTEIDGVDMSLSELVNTYQSNTKLLQRDDILNEDLAKILTRVQKIHEQALANTDYSEIEMEVFNASFGFRIDDYRKISVVDETSISAKLSSALKKCALSNYITND